MPFDLQPHLTGTLVELRPLREEDWAALYAVASDPLVWEQHPARNRYQEDVFKVFFREALESGGAFAILDRATQELIGSTRFYGFSGSASEVEIGWTFLARRYWGGRYNGEVKRLMLAHAFRFVDRVIFLVGTTNIRSQKAVERIGAVQCGVVDKGAPRGPVARSFKYVIERPR